MPQPIEASGGIDKQRTFAGEQPTRSPHATVHHRIVGVLGGHLLEALRHLQASQEAVQQQLDYLYALLQENPQLASSIAAAAWPLQQQLQEIQAQLASVGQAYGLAQQCASGTLTAQCMQLYG